MSGKRKCLCLELKFKIKRCVKNNVKKSHVAKEFRIRRIPLSTVFKAQEKNLNIFQRDTVSSSFKSIHTVKYAEKEEIIFSWFKDARF